MHYINPRFTYLLVDIMYTVNWVLFNTDRSVNFRCLCYDFSNKDTITSDVLASAKVFVIAGSREMFTATEVRYFARYWFTHSALLQLGNFMTLQSVILSVIVAIQQLCWSSQPFCFAAVIYRIYSRISRKIYDKIMPQKLGGQLIRGS